MLSLKRYYSLLLALLTCVTLTAQLEQAGPERPAAGLDVQHLRCEMLENPLGIDVAQPRLSWQITGPGRGIRQTAYQILVASSREKLEKDEADIWNSGRINSDQSIHVPYKGKALPAKTTCYWKVKVWTNRGETPWAYPQFWSTGMLNTADWKAQWIGLERGMPWDSISQWSRLSARYYRKPFATTAAVKRATVYVSGLGVYELYLNGKKIGDQVLAPAATDYTKSVLYNTFDVTEQVQQGNNVVAALLGNGRYFTMRQNYKPKKIKAFGFPKLLLQLEIEYSNGKKTTVVSDASWKMTADGPIRTNNEYDGEEYDATKEMPGWNTVKFDDSKWIKPELVPAPGGKLVAQMNEPIKVMQTVSPQLSKEIRPGVYIIDMGQNMVGWLEMEVQGEKGRQVKLRFAESLQPNGELFTANLRDAKVTDIYTLKGEGVEAWHPTFVYHGFRYVEVTNYPGKFAMYRFKGKTVYDAIETIGEFRTDNEIINQLHKNAWWGISGNYKGMPLDCPQRNERMPWLGDRTMGALGESFLFDNQKIYAKWLQDIEEAQTAEGSIPDVAPTYWNYYSDNMTWPAAFVTIADMLYTQYGNTRPIEKHYDAMKKWLTYMQGKYMNNYIVSKDKYGDWCVPPESPELIHSRDSARKTDGQLLATAYYYRMMYYMQRFAGILQKTDDQNSFADLAQRIRKAFNAKFLNPKKKYYSNNTVTANLLPLYFGITPDTLREPVFEQIAEKIWHENEGHLSTGVVGIQWLLRGLSRHQRGDLAYTIASDTTYPSWGYMVNHGATTIWELWNGNTANPGMNSQNHVMLLGDLLPWLYENLAGIKSDSIETGFKKIIMQPTLVDGLNMVHADYKSPYGPITSIILKRPSELIWEVIIPANTSAVLHLPGTDVQVNGMYLNDVDYVKVLRTEGETTVVELASGKYSFRIGNSMKKGMVVDEFIFQRASFPESHASTVAETPKGLVAAWFGGTKERNPDVGIWLSRQVNGHWTVPVEVVNGVINDTLRYACWNPVLYQIPHGELLLFYKVGPNVAGWKGWLTRSGDNGLTWSRPQALPEGFLGPIKNKPILMANGELWCPSSTEGKGWKVHFEVTPDFGKTWRKIGPIAAKNINAIQPSILTYKNGSLQVLCRSKNAALIESWSKDGGKTWSPLAASTMPNANSGTDAVTLQDGRQLLVYNHVRPPAGQTKGARTPLNVAISEDGKNWSAVLVLEDSPISQYSYPSVIQSADGMVHIVYTWRRDRIKYVKIDPKKLKPVKIENGQWP